MSSAVRVWEQVLWMLAAEVKITLLKLSNQQHKQCVCLEAVSPWMLFSCSSMLCSV